jgi:hypothetical protein
MRFRLTPVVVLISAAGAFAAAQTPPRLAAPLTVHEWGTFTSIAGEDGRPVQWLPQGGQSDLPCFVERSGYNIKGSLWGTVRMETPVLYFYTQHDVTVNVAVGFRQGAITEWYPRALVTQPNGVNANNGTISWSDVHVSPGQADTFPLENGPSHYYKARNTDATPLRAGSQVEKFLFYRGVGQFAPPLAATVQPDGRTTVWTPDNAPIGDVILFENRRGTIAHDVRRVSTARATLDRPSPEDTASTPQADLVRLLIANGLYPKEAQAMVDTWSDSWFEEGSRLLYIVPSQAVDAIVPLTITPAPSAVARVFVGRLELVTPVTRRDVSLALAADDKASLAKYGRFLQPIGSRVLAEASPLDRAAMKGRLEAAAASWAVPTTSCR